MVFIENIELLTEVLEPKPYTTKNDINGHCVYGYLREQDDAYGPALSIRYVGEGGPARPTHHHRVRVPSDPRYIIIFKDDISKDQGLRLEKYLVEKYGRICIGTGILENTRAGGGGWGSSGLRWTLKSKTCQHCLADFKRIDIHEVACEKNPNRTGGHTGGTTHNRVNCCHCNNLVASNRQALHESTCEQNPDRIAGPMKGKNHEVAECKFCDKVCSICNIERHEQSCKLNPNRVDGATKGRKSERKGKKYCKECGYVDSCIHKT